MFTGIVEEIGTLSRIDRGHSFCQLAVSARKILDDCKEGDSISINGACLTVTQRQSDGFTADVMAETMRRTNLGNLKIGDKVNLERSLRPVDRLGGHIVAGHVDEVGTIIELRQQDVATAMTIGVSEPLMKYIAVKGSVCIEGVSLTVTDVSGSNFQAWLIPFTKENTILGLKRVGNVVNVEVDMLARYVERLMSYREGSSAPSSSSVNQEFLRTHGFL